MSVQIDTTYISLMPCISNKFVTSSNRVELFDSMHTIPGDSEEDSIVRQVCCVLQSEDPEIFIDVVRCQLQAGAVDCGLFAVAMALDIAMGVDPFEHDFIQCGIRSHFVRCIADQHFTPFPRTRQKAFGGYPRIVSSVSVEIFCVCRWIETDDMAMCDVCKVWYHASCVFIPPEVFEHEELPWKCPTCEN